MRLYASNGFISRSARDRARLTRPMRTVETTWTQHTADVDAIESVTAADSTFVPHVTRARLADTKG